MGFLDWAKGHILGIPNSINRKLHPFDEFTRPVYIIDHRPVATKARIAWKEMERWRYGPMGEFYANAWPTDGGDHAFFQGQHTFAAVLRHDRPLEMRSMLGQEKLQTLGGDNRMARGADSTAWWKPEELHEGRMKVGDPNRQYYYDNDYVYHQNCSESSLIGQNVGHFASIMLGGSAARKMAKINAVALANQLIADEYRMLDHKGIPAKFGDLRPGITAAPIRVGTLACTFLLAYKARGDHEFKHRYEQIVSKNMGSLTHQETHVLWKHPYYQDLLAYYNYMILAILDRSGRAKRFQGALKHLWERTNHEGNPLYAYIAKLAGLRIKKCYLDQAEKTLNEFNLDPKLGPTGKTAGTTAYPGGSYPSFIRTPRPWGGKVIARQPLPPAFRPASDFFWQRDPYLISGHSDHHYNMLDLVLAEGLGEYLGVLPRSIKEK